MAKRARKAKGAIRHRRAGSAVEAALAGIAHDLRTPLTGILGLAELLAASDLPQRQREWVRAIKSGAEHLAALTTLIVDAARAEAAGLIVQEEPFSPRALAETVGAALLARAENKGLRCEVAIADEFPPLVAGDSLRLRAALENLADNAVKFTGTGEVRFSAAAAPAKEGRVRLIFTVTDSGIGLTPSELRHLFRPYAQASAEIARRYGGAGLGLTFVRRIARALGGDLTVKSRKGQGSTFTLTVIAKAVADARSTAPAPDPKPMRRMRVLCVEDNSYGRVVLNTILSELGYRADFVESGEAAVKAAAGGGYHAVLMDVALPDFDGFEATRRIRALPGDAGRVPIIGISGRSAASDEAAARAAGMDAYVVKPLSPARLAQAFKAHAAPAAGSNI